LGDGAAGLAGEVEVGHPGDRGGGWGQVAELGHHAEVVAHRDVLGDQAVPDAEDMAVPDRELAVALGGQLDTAPDTIYALCGPDVYLLLVGDRGWTPDRYQGWLATQLIRGLLR
jgi:hypothetical protein